MKKKMCPNLLWLHLLLLLLFLASSTAALKANCSNPDLSLVIDKAVETYFKEEAEEKPAEDKKDKKDEKEEKKEAAEQAGTATTGTDVNMLVNYILTNIQRPHSPSGQWLVHALLLNGKGKDEKEMAVEQGKTWQAMTNGDIFTRGGRHGCFFYEDKKIVIIVLQY